MSDLRFSWVKFGAITSNRPFQSAYVVRHFCTVQRDVHECVLEVKHQGFHDHILVVLVRGPRGKTGQIFRVRKDRGEHLALGQYNRRVDPTAALVLYHPMLHRAIRLDGCDAS